MSSCFFFNDTATTEIYTLSLHDALPILRRMRSPRHTHASAFRPRRPDMTQQDVTTGRGVDPEWLDGFLHRWEAAWDTHDPDAVLAYMTDDIVYRDSAWPKEMRGHDDVREFLEYAWKSMPDAHFEAIDGPYLHPSEPKA